MIMDNISFNILEGLPERDIHYENVKVVKSNESINNDLRENVRCTIWNPWSSIQRPDFEKTIENGLNNIQNSHAKYTNPKPDRVIPVISDVHSSGHPSSPYFLPGNKANLNNASSHHVGISKTSATAHKWIQQQNSDNHISTPLRYYIMPQNNKSTQINQTVCSKLQSKIFRSSNFSPNLLNVNRHVCAKVPEKQDIMPHESEFRTLRNHNNSKEPLNHADWSKIDRSFKSEVKSRSDPTPVVDSHAMLSDHSYSSKPSSNQHNVNGVHEENQFERLLLNHVEEFPPCNCRVPRPYDETLDGPFYTQLGVAGSIQEVREMIGKRLSIKDDELRLEKVIYTGKEGKSAQGCPIAKWIIRRSNFEEKVLVLIRQIRFHYCSNSVMVIGICLWDGLPEDHATELYDYLRITLPKYGEATERRCATNEKKTCACQGWNESSGGASFSFGCSWSMYYNGCKFARSTSPRKFHLSKSSAEEELILEHHLQTLATTVAPIYEKVAPTSFKNQTMFESIASDCRLGYNTGKPWSGVTAVVDFCTHSHKDFNNMNNGCTTVLTLTKHRGLGKADDEQLHVLPLCVLDSTDEFGRSDGVRQKMRSGALECLNSFPAMMRIRSTPFMCKRKQRLMKASLKKKYGWCNFGSHARKYRKNISLSRNIVCNGALVFKSKPKPDIPNKLVVDPNSMMVKKPSPVLPGFSQFVSSLANFKNIQFEKSSTLNSQAMPSMFVKAESNPQEKNESSVSWKLNYDPSSSTRMMMPVIKRDVNYMPSMSTHYVNGGRLLPINFTNPLHQPLCLSHENHKASNIATCLHSSQDQFQPHNNTTVPRCVGFLKEDCDGYGNNKMNSFSVPIDKRPEMFNQVDQKYEVFTNNYDVFKDGSIGGVAIALTHGSLLFEVAKRELHATTALKHPDRSQPTRMSLVFYQHKSLNRSNHGHAEYERKRREKKEKSLEAASQKCLSDVTIESEIKFPYHQSETQLWTLPDKISDPLLVPGTIKQNSFGNNVQVDFSKINSPPFADSHQQFFPNQKQWKILNVSNVTSDSLKRFSHMGNSVG